MSRVEVIVKRVSGNTVTLNSKNGVVATLTDGEKITIGNQFRPWNITFQGNKVVLVKDSVESYCYVGQTYLFALSSGSARNGVFHRVNPLKKELLEKFGINKVEPLENINHINGTHGNWGGGRSIFEKAYDDGNTVTICDDSETIYWMTISPNTDAWREERRFELGDKSTMVIVNDNNHFTLYSDRTLKECIEELNKAGYKKDK